MNDEIRLSPLGAARPRLLRGLLRGMGRGARGEAAPEVPSELEEAVARCELEGRTLHQAWELVRCGQGLSAVERRGLFFLAVAALVSQGRGSTRLPTSDGSLDRLLGDLRATAADRAQVVALLAEARGQGPRLRAIFGVPGDYKPLLLGDDHLCLQRMFHFEERLVASLRDRMSIPPLEPASPDALRDVLDRAPTISGKKAALSDEQQEAVLAALRLPLAVITGGPGTGKTSIVVSILRMLARQGVAPERIALAAPTGKAAFRMAESIRKYLLALADPAAADLALIASCPEPRTLHRLLGYSPVRESFLHHENNPLAEEVVIVDEASMIDLVLMDRLVRSIRPGARLVLLGDSEQLPSVDAGAVLRDLVPPPGVTDSRSRFSVRLTRSYRMDPSDPSGRNVLSVARAINEGRAPFDGEEPVRLRQSAEELAFEKVELLQGDLGPFLRRWHDEKIRGLPSFAERVKREWRWEDGRFVAGDEEELRILFRHFESLRLLCVTRETPRTGTEAVNAELHALVAGRSSSREAAFLPGEPVMMQRNDYERGLFNGDQGLVLRVREAGAAGHHFRAVFPKGEGFAVFHLDGLRAHLRLSYAMTVHKSQGSEFDVLGLILPENPMPLLTREILYTAVTRSRRGVAIVGSREVLEKGAAARLERHSGVAQKLRSLEG
ncbi:exodeoxyribonuclease V subunit alpha [Vulgatibacter incomptus]|uniref:Exodeoxyribonuclease V alpha chain n=1 Tax=Vulgatibacter incomptus TaxID=1391653 RepID=A0A0K1P883_9BACT|nr:exodeoxyribonuclease V subunit alpha [Vulgatibacter incomptus]AKU89702.1 Exodeoxyribonuclease V alpha chain [Vulgatibacter incomptus]